MANPQPLDATPPRRTGSASRSSLALVVVARLPRWHLAAVSGGRPSHHFHYSEMGATRAADLTRGDLCARALGDMAVATRSSSRWDRGGAGWVRGPQRRISTSFSPF